MDVCPSSTVPRTAVRPPPIAAVNSGWPCGDDRYPEVFGQRRRDDRDSRSAAHRCDCGQAREPRCAPTFPAIRRRSRRAGCRIASSSSLRVSRTSLRCPGRSATSEVTLAVDSRSLAPRHWPRSRVSDPIADVPDRSMLPAADRSLITWVSSAWSTRSPERSVWRTVGAERRVTRAGVDERDAGTGAAEVAQRDDAAGRHARIVLQRRQRRGGIGDDERTGSGRRTPAPRPARCAARRRPPDASARDR